MVLSNEGVHTDNIVIILDASGSMNEQFNSNPTRTKIEAAKEAIRQVLAKIPDGTNIGLLVFSGSNIQNDWVYPLGPKNEAALINAINLPIPGGGTPLGAYIKIGADRLLEQREKQYNYGSYRLLIVTDGEASDRENVEAYTPEVMEREIRVDVIGVDMQQEHMLATVVDSYRRADNPGELVKAVSEILAETSDTGISTSGEDVFEFIAPLSEEIASGLIATITKVPENYPIGEQPISPKTKTMKPTNDTGQGKVDTPRTDRSEQMWKFLLILAIAILVIAWLVRSRQGSRGS
jgi:uncharacterized protein YegL